MTLKVFLSKFNERVTINNYEINILNLFDSLLTKSWLTTIFSTITFLSDSGCFVRIISSLYLLLVSIINNFHMNRSVKKSRNRNIQVVNTLLATIVGPIYKNQDFRLKDKCLNINYCYLRLQLACKFKMLASYVL